MSLVLITGCLMLATGPQTQKQYGTLPVLARELILMAKADQGARFKEIGEKDRTRQVIANKTVVKVDAANLVRMRQIVDRYGWPGPRLVGKEASGDAWLLVQHAESDRPFQRRCLNLILPLIDTGEVERTQAALLIDRVLVGEGKKQYYGSQWNFTSDGDLAPSPIADEATVDVRRKAMNLEPLAEYGKSLKKMYANLLKKKG